MRSRRSSRPSAEGGFSLIELLVTLGLGAIVLASMTQFFQQHARRMRIHTTRIEVQQALRASLDAITRDVRLAGACLPSGGVFNAMTGTNGATDSITIRSGLVDSNMACIGDSVTQAVNIGGTVVRVADIAGFAAGQMLYLRDPNGSGEIRLISSVNVAGKSITLTSGVSQQYPYTATAPSAVYALDQRTYSVDRTATPPVLRLQVNNGAVQNFAAGIRDLQFLAVLNSNCPDCDMVDLSSSLTTAQWWQVNEIIVTATAENIDPSQPVIAFRMTQVSRAKPRNLLP